jgi:hypothetical protein
MKFAAMALLIATLSYPTASTSGDRAGAFDPNGTHITQAASSSTGDDGMGIDPNGGRPGH